MGVRRLGSPLAIKPFPRRSSCSSPEPHDVLRRKTSDRPSGEIDGLVSASAGGCEDVNRLFSPVSSETTNKASGCPSPGESVTSNESLSGPQARYAGPGESGDKKSCDR